MNTEDRTMLNNTDVTRVHAMVSKTGILDKFAEWKQDHMATRPAFVSERAILVGLLLLAEEQSPRSLASLAELLDHRLTKESRALLELPTSTASDDSAERTRSYGRTQAAFHRMLGLMDPYPGSASATSFAGIRVLLDDHDIERATTMKARLDEFTQALLQMTFAELPREFHQAASRLDLTIDQTFIPSPMPSGLSRRNLDRHVAEDVASGRPSPAFRPADVFAGWNYLSGLEAGELRGRGCANFGWGWMANIALRVDSENPPEPRLPALVVAATLSMPGVGISEEAIHLMRASLSTGLTPGIVDADKAYFASQPADRLHLPATDLGFTPSTDYRIDRLGTRDGKRGAVFSEGKAYCPDMPTSLKHASIDFHNDQITAESYRQHIQERAHFELRRTGKPGASGRYQMICRATAIHHGAHDSACAQEPVTFERTDGLRDRQAFTYKSAEWEAFHGHTRSTSERFNADVRILSTGSNETTTQHRVPGFAAAQVLTTILLTDDNRRITARYLHTGYTRASHEWMPSVTSGHPRLLDNL